MATGRTVVRVGRQRLISRGKRPFSVLAITMTFALLAALTQTSALPVFTATPAAADTGPGPAPAPEPGPGQHGPAQAAPSDRPPVEASEAWTNFSHRTTDTTGRSTLELSATPAFTKRSGSWRPVGASLTRNSSANSDAAAATQAFRPVSFARNSNRLLSIALDRGSISLSAPGLTLTEPVVSGTTVTYRNVAPGTDLIYDVTPAGVKEQLILHDATAPTSFSFHLSDPGGALGGLRRADRGPYVADAGIDTGYEANNTEEGLRLRIPPAIAFEQPPAPTSSDQPSLPGLADPHSAHLAISPSGPTEYEMTVAVDGGWLSKHNFPVVLDPTIVFSEANGAVTDASAAISDSICSGGGCQLYQGNNLDIGRIGGNLYRSFLKFDLSLIPANSHILSSSAGLVYWGCYTTCAAANLEIYRIASPWTVASLGSDVAAVTDGILQVGHAPEQPTTEYDLTAQTRRWVSGDDANYGMSLQYGNEDTITGGNAYYSSRSTNGTQPERPHLTVTYEPAIVPGLAETPTPTALYGSAAVDWQPPVDSGGARVDTYWVQAYQDNPYQFIDQFPVCGDCLSATYPGLANGVSYHFDIVGHSAAGFSGWSNTSSFTPDSSADPGMGGQTQSPAAPVVEPAQSAVEETLTMLPENPVSETLEQQGPIANMPPPAEMTGSAPAQQSQNIADQATSPYWGDSAFPGVGANGSVPPDPDLAVGPTSLVEVVNSQFDIYSKSGRKLTGGSKFDAFFSTLGTANLTLFDPRVVFDKQSNRFFIVVTSFNRATRQSYLFIAVSTSANPASSWRKYKVDAQLTGSTRDVKYADQPRVGVNQSALFITANEATFANTISYARLYTFNKKGLIAGTGALTQVSGPLYSGPAGTNQTNQFSVQPVQTLDTTTSMETMVNAYYGSAQSIILWRVVGAGGSSKPTIAARALTVPAYQQVLTDAPQKGSAALVSVKLGQTRMSSAAYRDGHIYTTMTTASSVASHGSAVRVYDVTLGAPRLWLPSSYDTVASREFTSPSYWSFNPAITPSFANSDLTLTFAISGLNNYPSAAYVQRLSGNWTAAALMAAGTGPITGGRFGDYAGAAADPDGTHRWVVQEYGSGGVQGRDWGTSIIRK